MLAGFYLSNEDEVSKPDMSVGQPERATQDRVIALFENELSYRYLGNWEYRDGNSNVEKQMDNGGMDV